MPSKAAHSKTRNGCIRCKARRVRCDKQGPTCGNCHRRREVCEYPSWKQHVRTAPPPGCTPSQQVTTVDDTATPVMRLFNHPGTIEIVVPLLFTHMPSCHPSEPVIAHQSPEETRLWTLAARKNAAQYQYIHHCIASIAYLFSQSAEPKHQLLKQSQAYEHQIAASSLFCAKSSTIDASNWTAVLIFAVSMIVFQFASQQDSERPIDYLETLQVLKRSAGISVSVRPFLEKTPMWGFIHARRQRAVQVVDSHAWNALEKLEDAAMQSDPPAGEVSLNAVRTLKEWARMCDASPRNWRDYFMFPGMVSNDYLVLLAAEDDCDLLVLIYWCAIMRLGPRRWFLQQWLPRTAAIAQGKLTGNWSDLLEWPNRVLCM